MTDLKRNILSIAEGHNTAEEVFMKCKQSGIKVSYASVYRILADLVSEKQLKKIPVSGQPDIFDKTTCDHEHIICSACGKIEDIDLNLSKTLKESTDIDFDSYDLTLKYVCSKCQSR